MKLIKEINESVDYLVEKNSESGEKNYFIESTWIEYRTAL